MSHQMNHPNVHDDDSSEPTPVPTTMRPPPPQRQQHQQAQHQQNQQQYHLSPYGREEDAAASAAALLESTLMSFSVDGADETLPSLTMEPPSPLSKPSDSLMASLDQNDGASTGAANTASRQQRPPHHHHYQQQPPRTPYTSGIGRNIRNIPPIHEVLLDDNHSSNGSSRSKDDDNNSNNDNRDAGDEDDTFFECMEDRSLANRARRSLRHGTAAATGSSGDTTSPSESSSRGRVLLSSPDGQPTMPAHSKKGTKGPRTIPSNDRDSRGGRFQGGGGGNNNNNYNHHVPRNDNNNGRSALDTSTSSASLGLANKHNNAIHRQNDNGNISSDDVVRVHESALQALQQLKEELVKSNVRNQELVSRHDSWQQERSGLLKTVQELQGQTQRQQAEITHLSQAHSRLQGQQDEWSAERQQMSERQRELEAQLRDGARERKEHMHRKLAADNRHKELRGQLDKLRDELEEALAAKGELAAELVRAQTDRMDLEAEAAQLKAQLADSTQQRQQYMDRVEQLEKQVRTEQQKGHDMQKSSEEEIERLNAALRKANDAMHRLRAELTPKGRSGVRPMSGSGPAGNANGMNSGGRPSTDAMSNTQPATLDSAIADRLARLRDSAERAHLIRGHKREIARLKAERDTAIHRLEHEHAEAMKKAAKQAEAKRSAHLEDLTKKMQEQHESQLEDLEEAHRKRISDLQKDYLRLQEDSDESLQEALSRVANMTQQYEREAVRRSAAEKNVENLQRQIEVEKKELQARHSEEIDKRRHEWEADRETMLVVLQKDCNTVFDHRRRNWSMGNTPTNTPHSAPLSSRHHQPPRPSPLSMNSVFFPEAKTTLGNGTGYPTSTISGGRATFIAPSPSRLSSPSDGIGGPPSMISQSYSDMDSVLRETEELVQSIL